MFWNKFLQCTLLVLLAIAFWLHGLSARRPSYVTDDARQMMMMAYNLIHHRTFSDTECAPDTPCTIAPSSYRGPGYPAFLAAGVALDPVLRHAPQSDLLDSKMLDPLRNQALWILFATAALVGTSIWILTGSFMATYAALVAVGFNQVLVDYQNEFYTEGLVAFLIALTSLFLLLSMRRSVFYIFGAGLAAGALTLTNPIFYYSFPLIALFYFWGWWGRLPWTLSLLRIAFFMSGFFFVIGPWMARNYMLFDRAFISGRGGTQLYVRAKKDEMTSDEYKDAFLYWSNCNCLREKLDPIDANPRLERLHRGFKSSFYLTARERRTELRREFGEIEADKIIQKEAMDLIKSDPLRHLLVSIPVAWRGMSLQTCGLDFLLFFALFALAIRAICKKDAELLAVLAPALFSFAFYDFFTYYIPRYSFSLIPTLWAALILLLFYLSSQFQRPAAPEK